MKITNAQVTINVLNLERSVEFYVSIGFRLENRWGNHYAELSAPGIGLGLHPTSPSALNSSSGNISIGLTTNDFESVKSQLELHGINTKIREEEGGRFVHFGDPDGNSLYFIQPKSKT